MRLAFLFIPASALLVACADVPALDDAISPAARNADFPALLPIDQLLSGIQDVQITDAGTANLQARIANLRARAARLRGPVIDPRTRNKMRRAIARHR